jgi:hypothetical protein
VLHFRFITASTPSLLEDLTSHTSAGYCDPTQRSLQLLHSMHVCTPSLAHTSTSSHPSKVYHEETGLDPLLLGSFSESPKFGWAE